MSIILLAALALPAACSKPENNSLRSFYKSPHYDCNEFGRLSGARQYEVYRYGMDHYKPPDMRYTFCVSMIGSDMINIIYERLGVSNSYEEIRDISFLMQIMSDRHKLDSAKKFELISKMRTAIARIDDPSARSRLEKYVDSTM